MKASTCWGSRVRSASSPTCVKPLLDGQVDALPLWEEHLRRKTSIFTTNSPFALIRTLSGFAGIYWFYVQIYKLGRGEEPDIKKIPMLALLEVMQTEKKLLGQRRRQVAAKQTLARSARSLDSVLE